MADLASCSEHVFSADTEQVLGKPKKKIERRPNAMTVARKIRKLHQARPKCVASLHECMNRQAQFPKRLAELKCRKAALDKKINEAVKEKLRILEEQGADEEFRIAREVSVTRNAIQRCQQGKVKNDEKIERLEAELAKMEKEAGELEKKRQNCSEASLTVDDILEAMDRKENQDHDSDEEMDD